VQTLWELVGDRIPTDHARQVHSRYYLQQVLTAPDAPDLMVDLGCGDGSSLAFAKQYRPGVNWIGVDIMSSDVTQQLKGMQVVLYDGVKLPFADESVPLIYSNQVMEHVRYPELLLAEIRRVLEPGGLFVGSTSQLEPYHAWSLWNYTIYGFRVIVEDAGLEFEEVRPGIDGISLVQRQWFGRRQEHGSWFAKSPLNIEIDQWAAKRNADAAKVNLRKLQFCGHFAFRVRKPGADTRFITAAPAAADDAPAPRVAPMEPLGAPPPPPPAKPAKPVPPPPTRVAVMRRRARRVARWVRKQARLATRRASNA
jgi:SAM-dependent methyltransferase